MRKRENTRINIRNIEEDSIEINMNHKTTKKDIEIKNMNKQKT